MSRFILIFLIYLIFAVDISGKQKTFYYYETFNNNKSISKWTEFIDEHSGDITINFESVYEKNTYLLNKDYSTKESIINDNRNKISYKAHRNNDELVIDELNNEKVNKSKKIDGLAWYQSITFGLIDFLKSDKKDTSFWSINPNFFIQLKLKAEKLGIEKINGTEAVKVKVSFEPFWTSYYWFRASDFRFVKNIASRGSKIPETTVELFDEK